MNEPASGLIVVNVLLGLLCLGCVIPVTIAVLLDVRERRAIRRSLPKGWPPDAPRARVLHRARGAARRPAATRS